MAVGSWLAASAAGEVRYWSGLGDGVSWNDTANWSTETGAPVGDSQETLIIPSGTATRNTFTGLKIKALWFTGTAATTVSGNELTFNAAGSAKYFNLSNDCPLTLDLPITTTKNYFGWYCERGVTYNGAITVGDGTSFTFGYNFSSSTYLRPGPATFYGPICAPNGQVGPGHGLATSYVSDFRDIHFYGPVRANKLAVGGGNYNNRYVLHSTSNEIATVEVLFAHALAAAKNAFGTNAVLKWGTGYYPQYMHQNFYDLQGYDQTIDRIGAPSYPYSYAVANTFSVKSSSGLATLTMRATASDICGAQICDAISLVYDPVKAGLTETLTNRAHTLTGSITVKGGTLLGLGATTFTNLSSVLVTSGGTFDLETTGSEAFMRLQRIVLQGAGTFKVGNEAVNPFPNAVQDLIVEDGAQASFSIPAGAALTVNCLMVNGEYLAGGKTYTSADAKCGWIKGGSVTVSATGMEDAAYWKKAADGEWNTAANWHGGSVPDGKKGVVFNLTPGTYTSTIGEATTFTNTITANNSLGGTVTLSVTNAFTFKGPQLTLGEGARIDVGTGGVLNVEMPTNGMTYLSQNIVLKDGAEWRVTGGTVDFTRGDTSDKGPGGFQGSVNLESASADKESRIVVEDGLFRYMSMWGYKDGNRGYSIRLKSNSAFIVQGTGVAEMRTGWWWNETLALEGGRVKVKDKGILRLYGRSGKDATGNTYYFGDGTVEVTDDARVTASTNSIYTVVGMPLHSSSGAQHLEVTFKDRACLDLAGEFLFGAPSSYNDSEHYSLLTLDSAAAHRAGLQLDVGCNHGYAEIDLRQGSLYVGPRGMHLGYHDNFSVTTHECKAEACVKISAGATLAVDASNGTSAKQTHYYGLKVGSGEFDSIDSWVGYKDIWLKGRIETAGTLILSNGYLFVGMGCGEGKILQTGGVMRDESKQVAAIGFLGGQGEYHLTAGTATFAGDLYVGGMTTNKCICISRELEKNVGGVTVNLPDRHNATGLLAIGAGTCQVGGNLAFSQDGTGTLTFTASPTAVGSLDVAGTLTIGAGSKLTVDLSAFVPGQKAAYPLVKYGSKAGDWAAENVSFVPNATGRACTLKTTSTGLSVSCPQATVIIFR